MPLHDPPRPSGRRPRRLALRPPVAAALAAGVVAAAALPASAATSPGPAPSGARQGAVAHATVTLLTGDTVAVDTFSDGKQAVMPRPGPGRTGVSFLTQTRGKDVSVVPEDALALLTKGALDPALFDVTGLVRQGFDDRSTPVLPLIVRYDGGASLAPNARGSVAKTAAAGRDLPSISAQAVGERKADAGEFWRTVAAAPAGSRLAPGTDGTLAPGIAHIWLDGRVDVVLDKSVPQIGAPDAWRAGYTGAGVRTAVLDTGIDATHPDLADAVAASADFTGNPKGAVDGHGHGTHVASIITGSGAASGGRYKGVAPDTQLLVGKVLSDQGRGSDSEIIAGMEWAVSQKARVVSMSLGAGPTDGTDPMSQAVNALSASSGALFVIAAGNNSGPGTVSTPGVADAALTVGAVDGDNHRAVFSSQGPRLLDHEVKPEITAPGVDITAARAAGTSLGQPVDDHYTRLSGTSMATPHVAGSAAILAQQHPDWTGAQLKDALIGAATPGDAGVFQQGTGRVNIAAAVAHTAYASPGALSTYLRWPTNGPVTRTVTYHNDADTPLTLDLAAVPDPGGTLPVRLGATKVTMPAHGTADATVTADPAAIGAGTYGGVLTASGPDGTVLIRTAIGVYDEPELYDLRVTAFDRDGGPMVGGGAYVINLDTGVGFPLRVVDGGALAARLPKGRYTVSAMIHTDATAAHPRSWTAVARPDVTVSGDTAVTLDARAGLPAKVDLDQRDTTVDGRRFGFREDIGGGRTGFDATLYDPATEAYAVPVATTSHPFSYRIDAYLSGPAASGSPAYNLALARDGGIPADPTLHVKTAELAVADVSVHTQGGTGTATVSRLAGWPGDPAWSGWFHSVAVPGTAKEYFTVGTGLRWVGVFGSDTAMEEGPPVAYPLGRTTAESWNRAPVGPVGGMGRCGDTGTVVFSPFGSPAADHNATWWGNTTGKMTLSKDGKLVASTDAFQFGELPGMSADKADYALHLEAQRDDPAGQLGNNIDATWTFSSARPADGGCTDGSVPLPIVRVEADLDINNAAAADRPLIMTATVQRPDGSRPRIKEFGIEASVDGGRTWLRLPAVPVGHGQYKVIAPPPGPFRGDGYVALRTTVRDTDGNGLKQTVSRAFRVAGR
ncbi:S8 family peptidase [Yinghuangia seranimata]|uniref:S8 family peptidase n=1 Tax=Yinghuangia seranimata TaxID=408067 RepID=UPI00248C104C|nr:S8 family peptidase [Yinghuangia seranimata]MDI2127857.1 S8 family peptidase [Yinghuangia seranimata]